MDVLELTKLNEAFIKVKCERSLAQELSEYFTFFVPNYQFTPAYKNKIWDGKIRLFDSRNNTIYHGLVPYIHVFCKERNYKVKVDSAINLTEEFSIKEAKDFISTLGLPFEPRDYQVNAFVHSIRNKRILVLSPTASGKSLIIYLILRYMQECDYKKGLLIVPTTSLCYQMFNDFKDYSINDESFNVEDEISIIMAGKDKNPKIERIKVTLENDVIKYYKPHQKIKTKKGIIFAKDLKEDDEIL
jgi:hypothetical protein